MNKLTPPWLFRSIKKAPGFEQGYVADLSDLFKYEEVRKGPNRNYEPFGCKTSFNETSLEDIDGTRTMYFPGDTYSIGSKAELLRFLKMLSSIWAMFTNAGATQHFFSLSCTCCMFIPPGHPLRRAFTPHFYKIPTHVAEHSPCTLSLIVQDWWCLFRGLHYLWITNKGDTYLWNQAGKGTRRKLLNSMSVKMMVLICTQLCMTKCDCVSELVDNVYNTRPTPERAWRSYRSEKEHMDFW